MLLVYIILVVASFIFAMLDMLKASHFRGYAIPSRACYDVSLVVLVLIAMRAWYGSSFLTIIMIVVALFMIGLLETGFRNKLQNRLTGRFITVISVTFIIDLLLSSVLTCFYM